MSAARVRVRAQELLGARSRGWFLGTLVCLVYALLGATRIEQHLVAGYDLGIFHQGVLAYSRFEAPIVPLKGLGYNIWGDHFHPILMAIAPLYWLWPNPMVLLLVQAALVGLSVVVVHGFAGRHWGPGAAAVAALAYGFGWPLQRLCDFDFHEIAFAVPLLALAIDALDRRDDRRLLFAGLVLLLVREDMGATVLVLGLLRLVRRPRWPAAVLMVAGPVMLGVATQVVLPRFNPDGEFAYWMYSRLGTDAGSALTFALANPFAVLHLMLTPPVKALTLAWLLVPVGLVCLRSPYLLLAAPIVASRLLSDRPATWLTFFHYNAPVWPVVVLAAIDGGRRLAGDRWGSRWVPAITATAVVVGMAMGSGNYPLTRVIGGTAFSTTDKMQGQRAIVAPVPADTCVIADDRIAGMLLTTNLVGQPPVASLWADYIVLDHGENQAGMLLGSPAQVRDGARAAGYRLVRQQGRFELYQAPREVAPRTACRP